jgi:hypothetical protein
VSALVRESVELRRVAVGDPLAEAVAVPLRFVRLRNHLIPVSWIRAEETPIAHRPGDARGMKVVFDELERPPKVPLPAVEIARQQHVERAVARRREHHAHRLGSPDRAAALGDGVDDAGVDEPEPLHEPVHLLVLRVKAVVVVLAGRRLANPASRPQAAQLVKRPRKELPGLTAATLWGEERFRGHWRSRILRALVGRLVFGLQCFPNEPGEGQDDPVRADWCWCVVVRVGLSIGTIRRKAFVFRALSLLASAPASLFRLLRCCCDRVAPAGSSEKAESSARVVMRPTVRMPAAEVERVCVPLCVPFDRGR